MKSRIRLNLDYVIAKQDGLNQEIESRDNLIGVSCADLILGDSYLSQIGEIASLREFYHMTEACLSLLAAQTDFD